MNPAPPTTPAPASVWRWWVCVLLMLATVVNYMDRMALNQTAWRIKAGLGIDNKAYSLLESAFSLAFAVGAVCTGLVVDRVSVRWVYPVVVLGWSVAGVLTGFAPGFWFLLACRFGLGLFEAGNWPCGIRTTRAVLPPEERSFGNSLFQSGTALGAVITPLLVLALLRWADPGEPHRNAVMAVAGGSYEAVAGGPTNTWRFPFRVIGSLGVVWVVLWFVTVPGRLLASAGTAPDVTASPPAAFSAVFRDPRFWALAAMLVAVNVTWHGYRTWLPLYLQEQRGFTEAAMSRFTALYYLTADAGAWTVGLGTLLLCRRGVSIHGSRMLAFASCAVLVLASLFVPSLPDEAWGGVTVAGADFSLSPLRVGLLAVAFGGLGLFPTFFALSQDVSAAHQGKVTGTLGACAHVSLAVIYPVEGWLIDRTGSFEPVLGVIGAAPLVAFAVVLWAWRKGRESA